MNNILREKQNNRYRKKYKFMKRRIKSLILENAALCDEVAKIQESILIVKDERKFLLRKLLEYANDADVLQQNLRHDSTTTANGPSGKLKKRKSLEENGKEEDSEKKSVHLSLACLVPKQVINNSPVILFSLVWENVEFWKKI